MTRAIYLVVFISHLTMNSFCQQMIRKVNDVKFETKFRLGEKDFFETSKDTASYLPDEIVSYPPYLYFVEKFSYNLIEFNTFTKEKRSLILLNSIIKAYHKHSIKNQIQQIEVMKDCIIVLFQDHFFKFNRSDLSLIKEFSIDPFAYFFSLKDDRYALVSPSGSEITFYDSSGARIQNVQSLVPFMGFLSSFNRHYFISNTYETIVVNEDLLKLGKSPSIKIPFTSDEKGKYVLMATADDFLLWADQTDINKIILTHRAMGYRPLVFVIDDKIIKDSDVTKFHPIDFTSADPPEARQYFRLSSDGKSIFIMFQSKGCLKLCSFRVSIE